MSHESVRKELAAGTPPEVICATCPWDRLCLHPPEMTRQQVEECVHQAVDNAKAAEGARSPDVGTTMLLAASIYAGRDTAGKMCPVLALRLRDDRTVADSVRGQMRAYQPPTDTPR